MTPATSPDTSADTAARGRPRDADRTAAILEATTDLLHTVGYDGLRVQDVATSAGCGLATIYRRWSTKEDLVADALRSRPTPPFEVTGDASVDLRAFIVALHADLGDRGKLIGGFMNATREHPQVLDAMRDSVVSTCRSLLNNMIGELIGPEHPSIPLLTDTIPGLMMFRAGLLGEESTGDELADEVMTLLEHVK